MEKRTLRCQNSFLSPIQQVLPPSSIISPTIILPLYYLPPSVTSLIHSSIISPLPPVSSPLPSLCIICTLLQYYLPLSTIIFLASIISPSNITLLQYHLPHLQYHLPTKYYLPLAGNCPYNFLSTLCNCLTNFWPLFPLFVHCTVLFAAGEDIVATTE